jgi:hypothetical protein
MVLAIRWFAAVAITTQVGGNYSEFPRQSGRDSVPHDVCLRVTMPCAFGNDA